MDEIGMFRNSRPMKSDITERKRGEEAHPEAHQVLQSALDALPAQIAILDEAGKILAVNAAWRRFAEADLEVGPVGPVGAVGPVGTNYLELCEGGRRKPARQRLE